MIEQHRCHPSRFGRSISGSAAVEFSLLLPFMLMFTLGGFEAVRFINSARRLTILANAIGQQLTANTNGSVTNADLHFFYNTAMVVFPQVLKDASLYSNYWWQDISISISSIKFTQNPIGCTSSCTYAANVIWSSGMQPRSCLGALVSQPDQAPPAPTALPAKVFGPGSLIVVDLVYTFRPIIGAKYFSSIQLKRSVYVQPRYVSTIYYQGLSNDDIADPCLPLNVH